MDRIDYKIIITYRGFLGKKFIIKVKSDTTIKDTFYNYKNDCLNVNYHDKEGEHKMSIPLDIIANVEIVELKSG